MHQARPGSWLRKLLTKPELPLCPRLPQSHASLAFSLAPVMQNHHRARPSVLCAHYPSTQDRAWDSFRRWRRRRERKRRVSAGPAGAGATREVTAGPALRNHPSGRKRLVRGFGRVVKTGWYSSPTHQGDVVEKVKLGSPLHIARAAQNCCGSLGDRGDSEQPSALPLGCAPYPRRDAPYQEDALIQEDTLYPGRIPPIPGGDTTLPRRGYTLPWRGCPPIPGGDTHPTQGGIPPYPWRDAPHPRRMPTCPRRGPPIPGRDAPIPGGCPPCPGRMPPPCHTGAHLWPQGLC